MKTYAKPDAFLVKVESDKDIMALSTLTPTNFTYEGNSSSSDISTLDIVNW